VPARWEREWAWRSGIAARRPHRQRPQKHTPAPNSSSSPSARAPQPEGGDGPYQQLHLGASGGPP
jgi:hypothetical protein